MRDFLTTLLDALRHGDLVGHLAAWLAVITGEITPETRYTEYTHGKH